MEKIKSLTKANYKVLTDIKDCIKSIHRFTKKNVKTVAEGISILSTVRLGLYEDLNQIQHEEMILHAISYLQRQVLDGRGVEWDWNPRQTGKGNEPDLRGKKNNSIVISAEITTSENPVGTIDKRMQETLTKLNKMGGKRFYFVRTATMEIRARTKVAKNRYVIEVIKI
jgi:hypothetical protein